MELWRNYLLNISHWSFPTLSPKYFTVDLDRMTGLTFSRLTAECMNFNFLILACMFQINTLRAGTGRLICFPDIYYFGASLRIPYVYRAGNRKTKRFIRAPYENAGVL